MCISYPSPPLERELQTQGLCGSRCICTAHHVPWLYRRNEGLSQPWCDFGLDSVALLLNRDQERVYRLLLLLVFN